MNDLINTSLQKLKEKKIPNPEIDLRVLLNYSKFSKNYKKEIILSNLNIDEINKDLFYKLLKRRLANEPISKIINKKNFWKDDFYVNEFVLDPRPETELIIEQVLKFFPKLNESISILDMCTGSGCLAISLSKEYPNSKVVATDISLLFFQYESKQISKY